MAATSRPWYFYEARKSFGYFIQGSNDVGGGPILPTLAQVYNFPGSTKDNAELIVRAVNSFDALLAACKLCEATFKDLGQSLGEMTPGYMVDAWNAVEAARIQAEKGKS